MAKTSLSANQIKAKGMKNFYISSRCFFLFLSFFLVTKYIGDSFPSTLSDFLNQRKSTLGAFAFKPLVAPFSTHTHFTHRKWTLAIPGPTIELTTLFVLSICSWFFRVVSWSVCPNPTSLSSLFVRPLSLAPLKSLQTSSPLLFFSTHSSRNPNQP